MEQIHNLLIPLPEGGRIPLQQVARVEEGEDARLINREDSRRYSTVQANVRGRDMGRFVADAQNAIRARVSIPTGYTVHWGGQFELQERSRRTFLLVTPLTLLLVTILLYTIFGSALEAGVILMNIPLALTGGLAALLLTGQYMSVPASIGFIAIFGIALEDGLVLLSTIRRRRMDGDAPAKAVDYGVRTKLRPVLMTTFTTIFGILPLLLATGPGAEIQRPLGTVVLGGLLTSTLVMKGENEIDTAMAKLVGLPMGIFVKLVMEGRISSKGVNIPVMKEVYEPVLKELEEFGVVFREREITLT